MSQWFTPYPNDEDGTTTIRISTVLISNVEIQGLSEYPLSGLIASSIKQQAEEKNAIHVTDLSHSKIMNVIKEIEQMDYIQNVIYDDIADSDNENDSENDDEDIDLE